MAGLIEKWSIDLLIEYEVEEDNYEVKLKNIKTSEKYPWIFLFEEIFMRAMAACWKKIMKMKFDVEE